MTVLGGASLFRITDEGQILVKAGWNLLLLTDDKSIGVHNPGFAFEIMAAGLNRIDNTDFITFNLRALEPVLSGDQEVPPVETLASGNAVLTLNGPRTVLSYRIELDGLAPGDVTQAHIHVGGTGENGPIIFFLCTDLGNAPPEVPLPQSCAGLPGALTGTLTAADLVPQPDRGIETFDQAVNALLLGDTYINVHTELHQGGEIRGRIELL